MKPVINLDELEFIPWGRGAERPGAGSASEKYGGRIGRISPQIGARQLGYNLTALPPGKCAFPAHSHRVNEEMFFVLAGTGELRVGAARYPLRAGDIMACPAGGPETAHQIRNLSETEELRFLAVSTNLLPEICDYPDSNKFGVFGEFPHGPDGEKQAVRFLGRSDTAVPYWEGE
jgi:uncharacterized cupin superfamily protein